MLGFRKFTFDAEQAGVQLARVNYPVLLSTLHHPVVWAYDQLFDAYLPGELPSELADQLLRGHRELKHPRTLQRFGNAGLFEPGGRLSREELRAAWQRDGYVRIPQFYGIDYAKNFLTSYYWRFEEKHERLPDMEGIKRTSANNLPLYRHLHQASEGLIKHITGSDIQASYSFASAYEAGSTLPAHMDRSQCVHNVSIILGSEPRDASLSGWPLWIERSGKAHPVGLEQGDAVLYSGTRDLHWRNAMPSFLSSVFGVFFHYVPRDFRGSLD